VDGVFGSIVPLPFSQAERPKPPEHLNEAERREWDRVVGRMPAGHFGDETLALLECYVVHTALVRGVAVQLRTYRNFDSERAGRLMDRLDTLSSRIASLATKLRLTPQWQKQPVQVQRAMAREAASKVPIWEA
jgi:hypothetical protein